MSLEEEHHILEDVSFPLAIGKPLEGSRYRSLYFVGNSFTDNVDSRLPHFEPPLQLGDAGSRGGGR